MSTPADAAPHKPLLASFAHARPHLGAAVLEPVRAPRPDYTIESVDNALRVILMMQAEESVKLSRVATQLGIARSSAHRLLGTMMRRGFAVQDERRRYRLGPAISAANPVDGATSSLSLLRARAHPHLRALSRLAGETVHLVVRSGTEIQFVDSIVGDQTLRVESRVGATLPAHVTAGGRALLAALERQDVAALYEEAVSPPELTHLQRVLSSVRQRGYGTNVGETERGITAIGVRIRGGSGPSAAVTLSARSVRLPRGRIPEVARIVVESARALAADLAG